jgi:hypothetical protein
VVPFEGMDRGVMMRVCTLAVAAMLPMGCAGSVQNLGNGVYKTKCKGAFAGCASTAREECKGAYAKLNEGSHAGGALADAIPGPVTWYTLTFRCGSGGETFASVPKSFTPPNRRSSRLARAATERVLEDYIAPSCKKRKFKDEKVKRCGAAKVYDDVWSKEAVVRLFTKVCGLSPGEPVPDDCERLLWRKWHARLSERYYLMDGREVLERCDGYPEECMDLKTFEGWCLESHNEFVTTRFEAEKEQIAQLRDAENAADAVAREREETRLAQQQAQAAQQARDDAQQVQRVFDELSKLGARMQGKPIYGRSADGTSWWQE